MKRRIFAILMVMSLCIAMLPMGVFADGDPTTQYATPTDVSDYSSMHTALPSGEINPDGNNIIWIPVARLTGNLTLGSGQDIRTLGKLIIPSGVTLTIGNGSSFEAETEIESGGAVIVQAGGYFGTTMGGDTQNSGTITVQRGGVMKSTMGASVVNKNTGTINLNGKFYCGAVNYDGADHLWFSNENSAENAISGNGDIIVYSELHPQGGTVNLDNMIGEVMRILGQAARFEEWDDINIYRQINVDSFNELVGLFNENRTVLGEVVDGNMDTIAVLDEDADITVPEGRSLSSMVQLVVSSGAALTVEGSLQSGILIEEHGSVTVDTFGSLYTSQGGDIENHGTLMVNSSAFIESTMGGKIKNYGTFTLNGLCYVGSICDATAEPSQADAWFNNYSGASITGNGHIVVKPVQVVNPAGSDSAQLRIAAAQSIDTNNGGTCSVPVFVTARTFAELQALNSSNDVAGIYLNGTATTTNGIFLMGSSDESIKAVGEIHVNEDIAISKKLCLDWADLIVDGGKNLTVSDLANLSFVGRRTRIVVEAGNLGANAGGTLQIGSTKVISGEASQNAVFTVKENIMALGAAQWAMTDYPAVATNEGGWYYVHNSGSLDGEVDASGTLSGSIALPLMVDGKLNITDNFTYLGTVEIRGILTKGALTTANIENIDYCVGSAECNIQGTVSTTYELDFDLNKGGGYDDIYDHLVVRDDRIYLQANGNNVPVEPTRPGYTFAGWQAESSWTAAATEELLASFAVTSDAIGDYVVKPTAFPVLMKARWNANVSSGGSGGGGGSVTAETVVTLPTTGSEDIKIEASVKDNKAVIEEIKKEDISKLESSTQVVVIDLSGLSEKVSAAELPKNTITAMSQSDVGLSLKLQESAVMLDANAVKAIAEQSGGENVSIQVEVTDKKLNDDQKEIVRSLKNVLVFDASVTSDGKQISNLNGGAAEVELPYAWDGKGTLRAAFVNESGNLEFVPVSYKEGKALLSLKHFSEYAIYTVASVPFMDTAEDAWYFDDVAYVFGEGIMKGVSENTFEPLQGTSRAMIVTMLYRIEGSPSVPIESSFEDVAKGQWYADAVIWAQANGIVSGYSAASFAPADSITREQLVTILYNYEKFKGYDVSKTGSITAFTDNAAVSAYAADAVRWAVSQGLLRGTGDNVLSPKSGANRAQVAAIIKRFCEMI